MVVGSKAAPPLGARVAAKIELEDVRLVSVDLDNPGITESTEVEVEVELRRGWGLDDHRLKALIGVLVVLRPASDVEAEPVFRVTADFGVTYRLPAGFEASREEYEAFVESSAVLTAWPFARELVQSLSGRAGFPQVTLPTFKVTLDTPATGAPAPMKPTAKKAASKKKAAPAKKASPSKKASPAKRAVPAKKAAPKKASPAKKAAPAKKATPATKSASRRKDA